MRAMRGDGGGIAATVSLLSLVAAAALVAIGFSLQSDNGLQIAANVAQLVAVPLAMTPLMIELMTWLRSPSPGATARTGTRTGKDRAPLGRAAVAIILALIGAAAWIAGASSSKSPPPNSHTGPPPAATDGVRCDPFGNPAVAIESIAATDGQPGIATFNTISLNVLRAAPSEYTYWIIAHLFRTDGSPYIAKAQIRNNGGAESHDLQFSDIVGSVRDIYIIEADPAGTVQLQQNNLTQLDGSQDTVRLQPPPGHIVSMTCHVSKTRQ